MINRILINIPVQFAFGVVTSALANQLIPKVTSVIEQYLPKEQDSRLQSSVKDLAVKMAKQKIQPSKNCFNELAVDFCKVVIISPIIEEYIFRDMLHGLIGDSYLGIIANSVCFGVLHYEQGLGLRNITTITNITLSGLVYTTLRVMTGNSIASMAGHMYKNFIGFRKINKEVSDGAQNIN